MTKEAMTPNTIILTDRGIECFEAPEKPNLNDPKYQKFEGLGVQGKDYQLYEIHRKEYQQKLKAAMKQTVLFKDQDIVCEIFSLATGDIAAMWYPEKGKLYPVPDGYEIKICVEPHLAEQKSIKYAILVPKQEPIKEMCGSDCCPNDGACEHCQNPIKQPTSIEEAAKKTPLQKLITKLKAQTQGEQGNYYEALDYAICEAESLLPEEKQRLIDANECFNPKHQSGEEYFNETFQQ